MIPYYQFRWVYASVSSLLMFIFCIYYDFYPQCAQLILAKKTENHLQDEIDQWRKRNDFYSAQRHALPTREGDDNLRTNKLIELLQLHWLSIQSMEVRPIRQNLGSTEVHLIAQGTFPQWLAFLTSLENKKGQFFVENFSIQAGTKLTIVTTIRLLTEFGTTGDQVMQRPAIGLMNNPFCETNSIMNEAYPVRPSLSSLSLEQLKMVGFMQYGQLKQAVLASPDHLLWVVAPGAIVGKEQAKTIAITEEYLDIQLRNGRLKRIHSE